ncbi:hypothetical protein A3778_04365 [Lacticaseibacillus paracasei]|uniref:hypothetical protein n=1 Tax=Lacticaseibacillus paracasei TaxID=1597 RepID=UPI0009C1D76E|nr:hypothetical protein [Lacticaseibacillus paracasei]ARE43378.1 hypothetical protein A3778_04365 [Lacticaseibacillus paracasei]
MNKDRVTFLLITLLAIIGMILGFWSPSINTQLVSGITTFLAILVAYVQFCYDKIDKLFVWWNHGWQWFRNPKADWEQVVELQLIRDDEESDEHFIDLFTEQFVATMKKHNYDIIRTDPGGGIVTRFEIRNPGKSTGEIEISEVDDDTYRITITYSTSYSYNQRVKGVEELEKIYQIASRPLTMDESCTRHCVQVRLLFEKGNPFYGYVIRKIAPLKINDFELKFESIENVSVSATNKYLQLDASGFSQLRGVLNDLIVLPNID